MIAEIVQRLKDEVSALKLVAGAAEFQVAAETNPTATPAAYVLPLEESAAANEMGNDLHQRVAATVGIVLALRNVADATGAAAGQDLAALRSAVQQALLGWQPAEGYDPLERVRSHLLGFRDQHLWWQDAYATAYFVRSY